MLFPFFIINLALSFSTVRKRDYLLATFIGVIPGAFVFVLAGTQLASIHDTRSLVSPKTVAVLLLLSLFALGPLMWRKLLARREERSDSLATKERFGVDNSPLTPDKVHHKEIKHSDGNDNK